MYIPKALHFWHVQHIQHEGTGLSTNLRSEWVFIALINIHARFQLIMTTGTCIYPRFLIFGISSMKELDFPQT